MRRCWLHTLLALLLWAAPALAGDNPVHEDTAGEPGREDLEIIAVMEILQIMDLAESMEMLEDMDVLIEEDQHENQD